MNELNTCDKLDDILLCAFCLVSFPVSVFDDYHLTQNYGLDIYKNKNNTAIAV